MKYDSLKVRFFATMTTAAMSKCMSKDRPEIEFTMTPFVV